jgi:hypothetical protein
MHSGSFTSLRMLDLELFSLPLFCEEGKFFV